MLCLLKLILTTRSGNFLECIKYASVECLIHRIVTSSRDSKDLSIGFDESNQRREQGSTKIKEAPIKSRAHPRKFLKGLFGYVEQLVITA